MSVDRRAEERKIDYRNFPFEKRARLFNLTVERLGSGLGKEGFILELVGRKITQIHAATSEEDDSLVREEINRLVDRLGSLQSPKVDKALLEMGCAASLIL